jgi:hypothetical protein
MRKLFICPYIEKQKQNKIFKIAIWVTFENQEKCTKKEIKYGTIVLVDLKKD